MAVDTEAAVVVAAVVAAEVVEGNVFDEVVEVEVLEVLVVLIIPTLILSWKYKWFQYLNVCQSDAVQNKRFFFTSLYSRWHMNGVIVLIN